MDQSEEQGACQMVCSCSVSRTLLKNRQYVLFDKNCIQNNHPSKNGICKDGEQNEETIFWWI